MWPTVYHLSLSTYCNVPLMRRWPFNVQLLLWVPSDHLWALPDPSHCCWSYPAISTAHHQTQRTATHPEGRGLCPGAPPTSPEDRQLRPSGAREHGIKDNKHAGDRQPSVTAAYVDLPHNCSQLLISQSDSWARLLSSLVDEVMDGRETIARDFVSRTHCQRCCICGNI